MPHTLAISSKTAIEILSLRPKKSVDEQTFKRAGINSAGRT